MPTTVTPGIVVSINGEDVPLTPSQYSALAGAGVSFSLERPVHLGTPGELAGFLSSTFGSGASVPNFANLPTPLDAMADRLANLDITVDQFEMSIAATKTSAGADIPAANRDPDTYAIGLVGEWPGDPIKILGDTLTVNGVFLKVAYTSKAS